MQAERTERVQHGPYELRLSLLTGDLIISRKEGDRPRVTVANVETIEQWGRFVAIAEGLADITHQLEEMNVRLTDA